MTFDGDRDECENLIQAMKKVGETDGNTKDFIVNFNYLRKEAEWNPSARFVIIIDNIEDKTLEKVFEELLDLHVYNVIVINGTNQADIYTYNPFENFACGRHFDRIISYGQCATTEISNYFPNKLVTGLRNCTLNIAVPHIPPLTFHLDKCDLKHKDKCIGTEEYSLKLLSELEHFKVNYSYIDFAETFSAIDEDNMTAYGSFAFIQNKQVDGLIGFTVLTDIRAKAFSYIYYYAAYADEFVFIVKKAGNIPIWQNIYIEFNPSVWALFLTCFVISSALVVYMIHSRDKTAIVLKMFDTLFLHGFSFRQGRGVRLFLITWIWFAYLMNSFYQSSLMSLTTHPSKAYQVSSERDLVTFKFRPCVTPSLRGFLTSFAEMRFDGDKGECKNLIQAMKKVCETDGHAVAPLDVAELNTVD
ncbi:uncharacterized protein LOC126369770 [Pectinophora gossypiella]|uniref:uncharacterized protein LOC126369770 n=1 Tax=Pectinophora gossypiella TaxID=13191 RepID=UPI00214E2708|nr:uncharacterized protein LOC126369770 [Pectinophora gossypiella]